MEEKRASLIEASQERQLLEEVKKRGGEHIKEYHRQEQNFLDEIAQLGFCRKEAGLYT